MSSVLGSGLSGVVAAFDDHAGMGKIVDGDGREWPFHCISIADGSRHIDTGVHVTFADGLRLGIHEAVDIRPA